MNLADFCVGRGVGVAQGLTGWLVKAKSRRGEFHTEAVVHVGQRLPSRWFVRALYCRKQVDLPKGRVKLDQDQQMVFSRLRPRRIGRSSHPTYVEVGRFVASAQGGIRNAARPLRPLGATDAGSL